VRRRILLSLVLAAGSASAGKFALLPALPGGAVAKTVQLDAAGNIFLAGSLAPANPKSAADSSDAFVAKLSPDGSSVVYFTILAGSGADLASVLALGADDSVTVAGLTSSSDFPVTPGAIDSTLQHSAQAFVAKLDPGGVVKYATYLDTLAAGIALDNSGNVFVLGNGGSPAGSPLISGGNAGTANTETPVQVPVTVSAGANGVLAVNVPIPTADSNTALISMQAGGIAVREPVLVIWTRAGPASLTGPIPAFGQQRVHR